MGRRGSGLRKICRLTALQHNFEQRFMPEFQAEPSVFRVVLWDMNYRVEPGSRQATDQVENLLRLLCEGEKTAKHCMEEIGLTHRPTFRENYLNPALAAGLVERTIPDKPNSRLQKYRLTERGRKAVKNERDE